MMHFELKFKVYE